MNNIYVPSYIIKSNSVLHGMIPLYVTKSFKSIDDVYKKGTSKSTKISTNGTISFDIISELNNVKFVKFTYIASTKTGDDSFEFTITFEDDTSELIQVNINILKNEDELNNELKYIELFCDKDSNSIEYEISLSELDYYATRGMFSLSNSDFLIDKQNNAIDTYHNKFEVVGAISNALINGTSTIKATSDLINNVNYIENIKLTFRKSLEKVKLNEYAKVKLYGCVDLEGVELSKRITYNFIFHQINIGDNYNLMDEIYVEPFEHFKPPSFVTADIEYPTAPEVPVNKNISTIRNSEGNRLSHTRPHKLKDSKGNKTIRLGKTVPEDAINLAYYYNATSSLKDTISVIETNTNTVTLHYVEDWVHRYGLPTNDEDQFLDYIEFEGKVGTYLEGFWGLLYRDYIMWEEEPLIDQNPEFVTIYEKFYGLHTMDVPQMKFHKNGTRSGMLELAHSIYTAIDFKKSKIEGVEFEPTRWECLVKYSGMIKDTKVQYNGSAKYSGVVTKKDGMSNLEPDAERELIMFPDSNGVLHLPGGDEYVDDDLFYITDKFKNNMPLYYKHKLKYKIYDSIGPDDYGSYNTESIKLITESNTAINEDVYKYKVEVVSTEYKNIYNAYVYTSFIPSTENPIYIMYNGLVEGSYENNIVNPLDIKVGLLEKLSVIPAFDTDKYTVEVKQGLTQKSIITIKEPQIIKDLRESVDIEYIISAEGITTPPISASVINKKYAIYNELIDFKNNDMIISTKNASGYMTAKDILFKYATDEEKLKINSDSIFKVYFNTSNPTILYNKDKVLLFTDPDGKGLIYARTYVNTGMPSEDGLKNKILDTSSIYVSDRVNIYKGYGVKCRNINQIVISAPAETSPLKGWYPKIRYSYFNKSYERTDGSMELIYSVPEFVTQVFGKYGRPYIDIENEKARYIGANTIKVTHTPMYIKTDNDGNILTIKAYKKLSNGNNRELLIRSHNFENGFVEFEDKLSENDDIYVSYTYEEQYYHYRGYYNDFDKDTKLIDLNLNPIMYNTFTDNSNEMFSKKNSYELFNRTIHFFLRPMRVIDKNTGEVQSDNNFTIYHKFDNQEALGPFDLHIGRIFVRHHSSLQSTVLLDTRYRGGGVIEGMKDELRRELEPASDFYLDIGTLDGKPYQENDVLVIRVDNKILRANGGIFTEEEVKSAIEKWSAYGAYSIIEFVEIIKNEDMPQNTLVVNKHISNQLPFKPSFNIEIIK